MSEGLQKSGCAIFVLWIVLTVIGIFFRNLNDPELDKQAYEFPNESGIPRMELLPPSSIPPITEKWVNKEYSGAGLRYLPWKQIRFACASASGTDEIQHFVNSYLVGFAPYVTENAWEPFNVIAKKKVYQRDRYQYGKREVWQTSREAYYNTRGDCEDHALVIADWMIAMGFDARVVGGRKSHNGRNPGGHAWVILFHKGKEYLLEATIKKAANTRTLPLARLMTDYHPECMFNRDFFWVNQGNPAWTTRYSGNKWVKQSRFRKD